MDTSHEPLRYAHDEGHTDVCYSEDGEYFITCGSDGDIRVWSVKEGEDPKHTCIGEWALSIQQKQDKIYVSTNNNEVQILTFPDGERDGILARATDPFNQIALCRHKNIAALAGEGMSVTVMDLSNCSVKTSFQDLAGPCLSVAVCPKASKVAASSGDGKLRVWDLNSNLLIKEFECFPKVNSFANAKNLCRLDFDPKDGVHLAYPCKNVIKQMNTMSWTEEEFICDKVAADFSILQYSTCGKYLAAATVEGDFVIWRTTDKKVHRISKHCSSTAVCALMWNPKDNDQIVYTDTEGQLSIMSRCSNKKNEANELAFNEDGFMDNEVDFGEFIDENDPDDDNKDMDRVSPSVVSNVKSIEDPSLERPITPDFEIKSTHSERASSRASSHRPRTPEVPMQTPFMPTSTPEHLDPRYLCWNEVGIVKSYGNNSSEDENLTKSIEVEFHDASFHNSMMVQNFQEFFMGSLGKGTLTLANSNLLMVIPLTLTNKEWTVKVDDPEEIVLVSTSENLVCFATNSYLIRIMSIYGTQRGIVSVSGPLVSMACFQNDLLVAYHAAPIRNGDQCINVKLFRIEGISIQCYDLGAALGPESTLYWLGFSDIGTPGMMDSLGMINLYPFKCNTWIPFCDTTRHKSSPGDNFFLTAIFESYQAIGGIRCKGTVYPGFVPRPTICELPIEPPFAESSTEKTQLEMNMFTWSILNVTDTERKYKEAALKLFALACKNDLDQRALELMQIIGDKRLLDLSLKYTTKLNKKRLAEKLMDLAGKLQEDGSNEQLKSHELQQLHQDQSSSIKPKATKLSSQKLTGRDKKSAKENIPTKNSEQESCTSNKKADILEINTPEPLFSDSPSQDLFSITSDPPSLPTTPSNPFRKLAMKKTESNSKVLGLSDEYAGVDYEAESVTKKSSQSGGEKRKFSDLDSDKPTEKQRKLSHFMFSKRT
ncbi:hypothetical protein ABEB36_004921 [Hypothenemus hampei]|uniref:Minichromosome loss protein Mcl1 middle region domain-containing protein n=1 Tax=Hypothenemus hampei TaxID=57062 RepID=A0ABD1EWB8_HYPHA